MDGQGKGSLVMLLAMWSLLLWQDVATQSHYAYGTGYRIHLPSRLDGEISVANYIHGLSSDIYNKFVALYSWGTDFSVLHSTKCHTDSISMPENNEQALKIQPKELIFLVIRLLHSWEDPLSHLMTESVRLPHVDPRIKQHSYQIEGSMQLLLDGLMLIARWVAPQIRNYGGSAVWTQLPSLQSADEKKLLHTFYHLCYCLRRDTHKIESFLKVLKSQVAYHGNC